MVLLVSAQLFGKLWLYRRPRFGFADEPEPRFQPIDKGADPDLKNATIIADPDFLLEALPYYIGNPTYLMREQRFGNVTTFTKNALLNLDLDDILNVARKLNQERGEPVIILMAQTLDLVSLRWNTRRAITGSSSCLRTRYVVFLNLLNGSFASAQRS